MAVEIKILILHFILDHNKMPRLNQRSYNLCAEPETKCETAKTESQVQLQDLCKGESSTQAQAAAWL